MRVFLVTILLLNFFHVFSQDIDSSINYYWEHGIKKKSDQIDPNIFYLSLINESLEDTVENKNNDKEILELLNEYDFTIEYQGIADDNVGYVFYRKIIFNEQISELALRNIYQKIYLYDKIQFFGPQIFDFKTNYGAGLQRTIDITFKPETRETEIDSIVSKYNLKISYTFNQNREKTRKVENGTQYSTYENIITMTVFCENAYGLEVLHLTDKLQNEVSIDKTLNHLYIQVTH